MLYITVSEIIYLQMRRLYLSGNKVSNKYKFGPCSTLLCGCNMYGSIMNKSKCHHGKKEINHMAYNPTPSFLKMESKSVSEHFKYKKKNKNKSKPNSTIKTIGAKALIHLQNPNSLLCC